MDDKLPYNPEDEQSIINYAQGIVGHSLRETTNAGELENATKRRGSLGDAVEEYYFKIKNNSKQAPDFEEVGLELKTTPIKYSGKKVVAKERLVLSMINYHHVINEEWETSELLKKIKSLLILFYLYEPDTNPVDMKFYIAKKWQIPEEDYEVIKGDFELIRDKVRLGKAHEILGSDTLYLEACTKAANSKVRTTQPLSEISAKPRAWAFKQSYINSQISGLVQNTEGLSSDAHARNIRVQDLVQIRFSKYYGKSDKELAELFNINIKDKKPKNFTHLITNKILGIDTKKKILEFEKAGIKTKSIRLKSNGVPCEDISFPAFKYLDLAERDFEESDFFSYLQQMYLFVIFTPGSNNLEWILTKVLFWQMPEEDYPEAQQCYELMRKRVLSGQADKSVTSKENRCCHVRPHARNRNDTYPTPYGAYEVKKCFWFNKRYIAEQIVDKL